MLTSLHVVPPLPRLRHSTFSPLVTCPLIYSRYPSRHLTCHLTHHLSSSPVFCIRLLHIQLHVMPAGVAWCMQQWALPSSLQICQATAPVLQDELSPWLLPPILVSSVSWPYDLLIFMIWYILFCKLFLTCFIPHLLDYHATCKHS